MGLFSRWFGRDQDSGEDLPITLDVEARRQQLLQLETSLDALANAMREHPQLASNPGWQARTAEYGRLAGEAMMLRKGQPDRESLLDLAFEVRPVFKEVPPGLEGLVGLQDAAMRAAESLVTVLPGER
ncbi:hypothetical protein GC722_09465 [Auraticoccus sp. F435]|uniref:Uncharacterized protein n=1 Tax=Auraticoccus cholistanensis TaxID=2656650 RepID=A0A6A9UU98_9ACTN|nr:hypothetical protein [Auraticoccus cholistanensis]MVA76251.1 hypothetical protein [Auraticoccus cholistanensis]